MGRELEDITREAMELTPESRAALARRLLDSLESLPPIEHERLWVIESARRYEELIAGKSRTVPAHEVFSKIADRRRE
jgi:putative addiction module component (TIGR02574 family)